ncbi:MAG: sulfatase [Actinomycetota bacterium]|nr:sulfatase [Actinomycetota bacterium]
MNAPRRKLARFAACVVALALLPLLPEAGAESVVRPPAVDGLWLVAGDGGIFSHGVAGFFGSTGAVKLNQPVVGMAGTPSRNGYWMVASDGGIFSFGDATFFGSTGAVKLNRPIVGMASTPSGQGYWLVATDGGIFSYGDAGFFGSTGAVSLNKPIVGMASTPSGRGYWMVASDGGMFAFGDARFFGSTGAVSLNKPIVGMASTPSGQGYWLVASDGGLFSFGDAPFFGSTAGTNRTVVGMVPTPTGSGYYQATDAGEVVGFGDAHLSASATRLNHKLIGLAAAHQPAAGTRTVPPAPEEVRVVEPPTTTTAPRALTPAEKGRPNILLIVTDDQRLDGTLEGMPLTRRWFQEAGTTFVDGYANTPLCCPERATIFSGRYMHNHGVINNGEARKLDKTWTIPRYLQDAGYSTAIIGKYLDGWSEHNAPPNWDHFAITGGGYVDEYFNVDGVGDKAAYSTDFIAEKSLEFLADFEATDDAKPWYVHVTPHAPHDTSEGTFDWAERHADDPIPAWHPSPAVTDVHREDQVDYIRHTRQSDESSRFAHDGQLRTLLAVDEMVDAIFRRLAATGELNNTLAVFTSDNGYSWGERGVSSKGLPYVESVKVPFLVRWPDVFAAGAVDTRPVGGVDLLPTILEATQTVPAVLGHPFDGRSFLPGHPGRDSILLEFSADHRGIPPWASLRNGDWQYIEYYQDDDTTLHFREYYDLAADPWQLDNLLADTDPANDPDVDALSTDLAAARQCAGSTPPQGCP